MKHNIVMFVVGASFGNGSAIVPVPSVAVIGSAPSLEEAEAECRRVCADYVNTGPKEQKERSIISFFAVRAE